MPTSMVPGAVCAAAIWVIFAFGMMSPQAIKPKSDIWVASSSEKNRTHPILVRAAYPIVVAQN